MYRIADFMETFKLRFWLEDDKGNTVYVKIYEDYADDFSSMDLLELRAIARALNDAKLSDDYIFASKNRLYATFGCGDELWLYIFNGAPVTVFECAPEIAEKLGIPQRGIAFYDSYSDENRVIRLNDEDFDKLLDVLRGPSVQGVLSVIARYGSSAEHAEFGVAPLTIEAEDRILSLTSFNFGGRRYLTSVAVYGDALDDVDLVTKVSREMGIDPGEIGDELALIKDYEKLYGRVTVFESLDSIAFERVTFRVSGGLWRSIASLKLFDPELLNEFDFSVRTYGNVENYVAKFVDAQDRTQLTVDFERRYINRVVINGVRGRDYYARVYGDKCVDDSVPAGYELILDFNAPARLLRAQVKLSGSSSASFVGQSVNHIERLATISEKLVELGFGPTYDDNLFIMDFENENGDIYASILALVEPPKVVVKVYGDSGDLTNVLGVASAVAEILGVQPVVYNECIFI